MRNGTQWICFISNIIFLSLRRSWYFKGVVSISCCVGIIKYNFFLWINICSAYETDVEVLKEIGKGFGFVVNTYFLHVLVALWNVKSILPCLTNMEKFPRIFRYDFYDCNSLLRSTKIKWQNLRTKTENALKLNCTKKGAMSVMLFKIYDAVSTPLFIINNAFCYELWYKISLVGLTIIQINLHNLL